ADEVLVADVEPTPPSPPPTATTPPPQELPFTSQVSPTPPPSPIAQPSSPPQQPQPSQPTTIFMDLVNNLLETFLVADVEPTPPSPPPTATTPPPQELPFTSQVAPTLPPSPIAQPSLPPQQPQPSQPTTIFMDLKYFNSNVAFLEKSKEQLKEEKSRALKKQSESLEEKAVNKQKLDEEVEELKKHLQIVLNDDDDDVYTEATALALKDLVIVKAQELLRCFLLTTLTYMFEKPDVKAQVWKNQRSVHGLAKVKSHRLLESCRVHIITFTTTHMILLVERRYPLTRFTLEQMLNNVKLEVKEESEVSLELLRFVRQQQQEGYKPE
nr:hypothetical protein [Tanacetum cinerariifolium]